MISIKADSNTNDPKIIEQNTETDKTRMAVRNIKDSNKGFLVLKNNLY